MPEVTQKGHTLCSVISSKVKQIEISNKRDHIKKDYKIWLNMVTSHKWLWVALEKILKSGIKKMANMSQ